MGMRMVLVVLAGLALLFPGGRAARAGDPGAVLRGPAFFPPGRTVDKPQQWLDAPIVRSDWAQGADVAMTLDQHLYPAFLPMIQAYARQHRLNIAVREGTCGTTEGAINRKQVDVGGYCCPPAASDRLPGLAFHTIGIAALAILVHPDNPVADLDEDQVRGLFQGRYRNWSELPAVNGKKGLDLPIRPVGRLHCKARPGHWRLILDHEDLFAPNMTEVGTIPDMISSVAGYKGAVGYEVLWNLGRFRERGTVRAIRVNGVAADDADGLARGRYPFYRTDNMSTWETPALVNDQARAVVAHVLAHAAEAPAKFHLLPAQRLREAGWRFSGNELVGAPE